MATLTSTSTQPSFSTSATLRRTALLWAGSNVGGTAWLLVDFASERFNDYSIALFAGLLAALVSLPLGVLVVPFFAFMQRAGARWQRQVVAAVGVTAFYCLANVLLLLSLPLDSFGSLVSMSFPYLAAALLMVGWLYGPGLPAARRPEAVRSRVRQPLASSPRLVLARY